MKIHVRKEPPPPPSYQFTSTPLIITLFLTTTSMDENIRLLKWQWRHTHCSLTTAIQIYHHKLESRNIFFSFRRHNSVTHLLNYVLIVIILKLSPSMFVHSVHWCRWFSPICGREISNDHIWQKNILTQLLSIKIFWGFVASFLCDIDIISRKTLRVLELNRKPHVEHLTRLKFERVGEVSKA